MDKTKDLTILGIAIIAIVLFIKAVSRLLHLNRISFFALFALGLAYLILLLIILLVKTPRKTNEKINYVSDSIIGDIEAEEIEDEENKEKEEKPRFIGSKKNKKYHLTTCRFAKGIGEKYAEYSDTKSYFKKKGYVPCKTCKPDKA